MLNLSCTGSKATSSPTPLWRCSRYSISTSSSFAFSPTLCYAFFSSWFSHFRLPGQPLLVPGIPCMPPAGYIIPLIDGCIMYNQWFLIIDIMITDYLGNWLLSSVWSGLCPSLAPLPRRRSSTRWISGTTRWGEVVSCPMPSNVQGGRTTHITKIELLNPGLWDEARWRQAPRTEVPLPPHWHGGLCDHWSSSVFTTITITITIVMNTALILHISRLQHSWSGTHTTSIYRYYHHHHHEDHHHQHPHTSVIFTIFLLRHPHHPNPPLRRRPDLHLHRGQRPHLFGWCKIRTYFLICKNTGRHEKYYYFIKIKAQN